MCICICDINYLLFFGYIVYIHKYFGEKKKNKYIYKLCTVG